MVALDGLGSQSGTAAAGAREEHEDGEQGDYPLCGRVHKCNLHPPARAVISFGPAVTRALAFRLQRLAGLIEFLPLGLADLGIREVERGEGVDDGTGHDETAEPLVVRRDDIPG